MNTVYKVVIRENDELWSVTKLHNNPYAIKYIPGEQAVGKFPIIAFDKIEHAEYFVDDNSHWIFNSEIWKCEAEEDYMIGLGYRLMSDTYFDAVVQDVKEWVKYFWDNEQSRKAIVTMPMPMGTVLCKWVKPIERVDEWQ